MGLLKTNLLLTLAMVILTSCGNYEEFKEDPASSVSGILPSFGVGFEEIKKEVLKDNCLGCHGQYNNYSDVVADLPKIQFEVASGSMPDDGVLADDLKLMLLSWIVAGAPQGAAPAEPDPVDDSILTPDFNSISKNIIQKKCISCHNPRGRVPWIDFSTRQTMYDLRSDFFDLDNPEESFFLEVVSETDPELAMPPSDSPFERMTDEEIAVVKTWIELGMPNTTSN